jgi:hypothetical protein
MNPRVLVDVAPATPLEGAGWIVAVLLAASVAYLLLSAYVELIMGAVKAGSGEYGSSLSTGKAFSEEASYQKREKIALSRKAEQRTSLEEIGCLEQVAQ